MIVLWTLLAVGVCLGRAEEAAKLININRLDECIQPLDAKMQPPYFLVPLQPDDLLDLIRFDSESGVVCFSRQFEQIKFTALSINQGLALNLEINFVHNRTTVNRTHVIPSAYHGFLAISCSDDPDNATKIDQHLFYSDQELDSDAGDVNTRVSPSEATVEFKCPSESTYYIYCLKLENPDSYFVTSENRISVRTKTEPPVIDPSSSSPIYKFTSTAAQITKTAAKITKLSFNLKMFSILAATLASLLVVLIYAVFLTVKRWVRTKNRLFYNQPKTDSCNTMDTRSSIHMNELPSNSTIFTTIQSCRSSDPTRSLFVHSDQYLSRLGIDMNTNLSTLMAQRMLNDRPAFRGANYNSDARSVPLHQWCNLLNWDVDFKSMSDVLNELAKFK